MARWEKRTIRLPQNHGWRAKPGNKIFVADRGAVQFEIPGDWVIDPGAHSIRIRDRHEPDDDIRLEVSVIQLNPDIDWNELPLVDLVEDVVNREKRDLTGREAMRESHRADLDVAWLQVDFTDPNENRKAHSRICFARGSSVLAFITMDFWPEDRSKVNSVWKDVQGSLKLGERIQDPTMRSKMN